MNSGEYFLTGWKRSPCIPKPPGNRPRLKSRIFITNQKRRQGICSLSSRGRLACWKAVNVVQWNKLFARPLFCSGVEWISRIVVALSDTPPPSPALQPRLSIFAVASLVCLLPAAFRVASRVLLDFSWKVEVGALFCRKAQYVFFTKHCGRICLVIAIPFSRFVFHTNWLWLNTCLFGDRWENIQYNNEICQCLSFYWK